MQNVLTSACVGLPAQGWHEESKVMLNIKEIAIIIASTGRPAELGRWINHIERQTIKPTEMIWVVSSNLDLPPDAANLPSSHVKIIQAPKSLTAQRNAGLDALHHDVEIVAFFDDDYVPSRSCLADIVASFTALPDVVGLTGRLLADGINTPGISYKNAERMIQIFESQDSSRTRQSRAFKPTKGLYGCNMAFRRESIGDCRFDERLPLYAWQEDWDFASRVSNGRKIGWTDGFVGVHQGVKNGRTSGTRFGYSQIANPIYLYRKGSMDAQKASMLMLRNLIANHVRAFRSEAWIDRRGRVTGNWLALRDFFRSSLDPKRVLEID